VILSTLAGHVVEKERWDTNYKVTKIIYSCKP